ncbi:PDR/VanB family oxidoreductase [Citricoccus muralis]|uniref:Ferredoxin-NADP reductase n=1 Tax=Citricoccus muralis TaxID=169134 RepID=A0A3D9LD65_9MICC|nr:PDR/VanB family oxidoreductase [Citricoccus muralis]REE04175.1 ferredoxin-NADP reductase [Citricoccus muralis]
MTSEVLTAYRRPLPLRRGLELVVREVRTESLGVCSVVLERESRGPLPEYVPGSHVLVECAAPTGTTVNAYSLTGSGNSPVDYAISVQFRAGGTGGSAFIHGLVPGDRVQVSLPRNGFAPTATATHHVLVAGGIGITPVLSHAEAAVRWGRPFTVLFGYRDGSAPHLERMRRLCGERLVECVGREALARQLTESLRRQPMGTHLYVCGSGSLTDATLQTARDFGWPEGRLHHEVFDTVALDPGEPFTVRLARSGGELPVPSGVSLLEALEVEGIGVPNLCRQGVCGECRLSVTAGTPVHRDSFLSPAEKSSNTCLMPCVSRSEGPILEVDL